MQEFLIFALVGFLAQAVDGALGMAYGVISSTTLLAFGVAPANASAAVHTAKLFTTAASGAAHFRLGNVDRHLFVRLAPFGVAGGIAGAFVLTSVDAHIVKPFVTSYLALVGVWLLVRSFRRLPTRPVPARIVSPLGAVGGFLDAIGGGGWGPVVTTGLLGSGGAPRYVIGSVNASEFLVSVAVALSFLFALLSGHWDDAGAMSANLTAIAGLIIGGLFAAPLAGLVVMAAEETLLLRLVGCLIVLLAGWQTAQYFGMA
ncbi:MAG: sulfite exporter TauE/SafE family protein [Pseudomonadota bacterium]